MNNVRCTLHERSQISEGTQRRAAIPGQTAHMLTGVWASAARTARGAHPCGLGQELSYTVRFLCYGLVRDTIN